MRPDRRAHDLAALAVEMSGSADVHETAATVVRRAVALVPGTDWASLTLRRRRRRFTTLAASHPQAQALDERQYDLGEGPCVEVADLDTDWFRSDDLTRDERWPEWAARATQAGVRSMLSVRLRADERPMGALNLYALRPASFADEADLDFAMLFATHAGVALDATRELQGLTVAMGSRHTIGLAQGILVERFDLGVDQSFALLRRYSNELNQPLAALAAAVVAHGELPDLSALARREATLSAEAADEDGRKTGAGIAEAEPDDDQC